MARPKPTTGLLAPIALAAGLGLLACSLANALARGGSDPMLLYWAGVLLIALPVFWRLTSREASLGERLALVCLLGLSLYGVKVVRDAPLFTFSDELVHAFNADQIAHHGELFRANPILAVTPNYPGLEGATSALMELTGISSYWAGVLVVAAARLSLMIGLFLLFTRISGSPRTAGLGTAIYTANFNFLFWGAQFSYESLALPLLVVVLMAVAERGASPRQWAHEWAVPIVLGIAAIVVTHHLTSYATAVFLAALAVVYWALRRDWRWPNPWPYAVLAAVLAVGWLLLVASSTFGYLSPVLSEAFEAIFNTASGEAPPRGLFQGKGPSIPATPLPARAIALLAVVVLAAAMPFGLKRLWDRYRREPYALIFAAAAISFFATLLLRLAPAAWETGNRLSEYLFIGLAFVAALAAAREWRPRGQRWLGRGALTAAFGVIVVGGAIAGWPWDLQLSSPMRVSAEGRTISSPPLALAEWARREIPPRARFGATIADARLLLAPGEHVALAGKTPDIEDILEENALSDWELPLLRREGVRYVVADRRQIASDATRGYFFATRGEDERLLPLATVTKFGQLPGARRVYSSGDISVYELERPE
ncbi:MAG TPA: hypothetical protein VG898_06555 [Solirubrobacterales bacterium]|nr:hypothetical protein [Solirubrobacterales bacterium]